MKRWAKFLMLNPVRLAVFLLACGLLAAGIYGTVNLKQENDTKKIAPDGSSYRAYAVFFEGNYPQGTSNNL